MSDTALVTNDWKLGFYVFRRQRLKDCASMFLAVSDFIRKKLLAKGFPEEKILVHYVGVDTDLFQADPRISREDTVLFVGRLVENKGCEYLLRAMQKVQSIVRDVRTVVIGEGPLRTSLEQLARQLGLRECTFLGSQPPHIVREWMSRSRVFCVPSIEVASGASEAFGLVFAEAQSMSLPVVSFQTGGIPEAVANEKTGFLVSVRDERALAEKILILFREPNLWTRFSNAARERIQSQFDLRKQTAALEEIYEAVLCTGSSPATAGQEYKAGSSAWSASNV